MQSPPPLTKYLSTMDDIRPPQPPENDPAPNLDASPPLPEIDPNDTRPVVIVAPELRGQLDAVVVRTADDTDETYQSRCALFALILENARED
ncbi:MAG: hypothetical protein P4L48_22325 [Mycobacterium sp.]|nr:hypothetical protein [Mycobacterium sp.]